MANNNAHQNPSTLNPGTIAVAKRISSALITKVNNPSVIRFIGSVKISRIGLSTALIIPKTTAKTSAVVKLAT